MQVTVDLCLPRDAVTIPVARHIVQTALVEVGVTRDCSMDIEMPWTTWLAP